MGTRPRHDDRVSRGGSLHGGPRARKLRGVVTGGAQVVVVGGGLAGLAAAVLAARRGASVTLVEREATLGGLLASVHYPDAGWFDWGTHIPATVGDAELDEAIVCALPASERAHLGPAAAGSYSFGALCPGTNWPSVRNLPRDVQDRGLVELIEAAPNEVAHNCADSLRVEFGETFGGHLGAALERLFGIEMSALAPGANRLFGAARIVASTAVAAAELKQVPRLDRALAFHDQRVGATDVERVYPKRGGVGAWFQAIVDGARSLGVRVLTSTQIVGVDVRGRAIAALTTASGESLAADLVVWSVPMQPLVRFLDGPTPPLPQFRRAGVVHYLTDRPYATDRWYITVYDPNALAFRVTLYGNVDGDATHGHRVTVEFLVRDMSELPSASAVREELVGMGIIDSAAGLREVGRLDAVHGFPIPTPGFYDAMEAARAHIDAAVDNVALVGRARGQDFFMNEVLVGVAREIRTRLGSERA
ncbi:MAG: FAD-dependent oxidoreductase [Myxococcales bacterium]|nr:FAD-dependent oxidoreductase [Myxococcales bacterium]MCB9519718.1 FAD-dependent oxidoreductase [Myxococcales bacterium]MCB9533656.1 FAD-dependent oxidoreductase [Myxococcales bacterium]